jgi:hydrogenase maturation factor
LRNGLRVAAIAEGTLLIAADHANSVEVLARLKAAGINALIIVTANPMTRTMKRLDGHIDLLEMPKQDPFWPVFFEGLAQG